MGLLGERMADVEQLKSSEESRMKRRNCDETPPPCGFPFVRVIYKKGRKAGVGELPTANKPE